MSKLQWVIIIALGVFVGLCLCVLGLLAFASLPSLVPKPVSVVEYDVDYTVISSGDASLTYNNEQGDSEQTELSLELPRVTMTPLGNGNFSYEWHKTFKAKSGAFLYISAQVTNSVFVSCLIGVNGKAFKQSQSRGQYSIATCSGRLP